MLHRFCKTPKICKTDLNNFRKNQVEWRFLMQNQNFPNYNFNRTLKYVLIGVVGKSLKLQ